MKAEVLVDWLTFTVKVDNPDEVIRDWLGMEPDLFESFPYGLNGYLQSKRFSSIIVAYNGYESSFFSRADMGVCVSMSGDGCRAFERYSSAGFQQLFKKLVGNVSVKVSAETGEFQGRDAKSSLCNVSRIDVACDDKAGLLDMSLMDEKAVDKHEFNSRMRSATDYRRKDGDDWVGHSIYIGSEKSDFRIRIYDKALEQKDKGDWKRNAKGDWVRVEMVMRHENALGFVMEAAKGGSVGKLAAQVLNDKFRFIDRDDSNISRCTVCKWWADFVEEIESLVIWSRTAIQSGIGRLANWLKYQASSSMALVFQAYGGSYFYSNFIKYGGERLSRRQEALLRDFNAHKVALGDMPFGEFSPDKGQYTDSRGLIRVKI